MVADMEYYRRTAITRLSMEARMTVNYDCTVHEMTNIGDR